MQVVFTLELQQDDGTPILSNSITTPKFTSSNFDKVFSTMVGDDTKSLLRMMGWVADGTLKLPGATTISLSQPTSIQAAIAQPLG